MSVRLAQFAGTFYPDDPQELREAIGRFLNQATIEQFKSQPRALIVPHAGYIYSGQVAAYGFKTLENYNYQKIILLGPSHHFNFQGLAAYPKGHWETPLGKIETLGKNDFSQIKQTKEIFESEEIHQPEHCLEVELPFLQMSQRDFKIFPLLIGNTDTKTAVKIIGSALDDKTLLVVSSDLSHYYSYNEAQKLDKVTIDSILDSDEKRLIEFGEACGSTVLQILIAIAKNNNWQVKLLKAMNSGETTKDKSQVVGYASMVYF